MYRARTGGEGVMSDYWDGSGFGGSEADTGRD
jgi:hypothetical protein